MAEKLIYDAFDRKVHLITDTMNTDFIIGIIPSVRAVRQVNGMGLKEALRFIANELGFDGEIDSPGVSPLSAWYKCRIWLEKEKISLEGIQGPHALTLLKMLAIKHGRTSVSEQPK